MSSRLGVLTAAGLLGLALLPFGPTASAAATPLVVKVDHIDQENQQPFPPFNRLFEYTDFFSRSVTVHRGDTINFQAQPASVHIVALAKDEDAARRAYPIFQLDTDDAPAPGTGLSKIVLGPGNFSVTGGSLSGGGVVSDDRAKGPPVCGVVQFGQPACTFRGGDDVEVIGPTFAFDLQQRPTTLDQNVVINAAPGTYYYFDMLHPGMSGTLKVVAAGQPASTQAQVDAAGERQFQQDKAAALKVERDLNARPVDSGTPGSRDIVLANGAEAAYGHVLIDEILPNRPINVTAGDRVRFALRAGHGLHTLGFAPQSPFNLPPAFGSDCGNGGYQGVPNVFNVPAPPPCLEPGSTKVEWIGDPGNTRSGSALAGLGDIANSGLLIGADYDVHPTSQKWSAKITSGTAPGAHTFFDAVHPWMAGTLNVQ